ncbi:hypothetical protein ACFE04_030120 [Oxalis oulophora]
MLRNLHASVLLLLIFISCHGVIANDDPIPKRGSVLQGPPLRRRGEADSYLYEHNKARAEVGVGPLKWSETVAKAAANTVKYQKVHAGCQFANDTSFQMYGGNQALVGNAREVPASKIMSLWMKGKKYYNYANNSCEANHKCGLYTQIVWRKSLELGCAQAICVKEKATLTICYYNPPGNIEGERPY